MPKDLKHRIPAFRTTHHRGHSRPTRKVMLLVLVGASALAGWMALMQWTKKSPAIEMVTEEPPSTKSQAHFTFFRILEDQEHRVNETEINEEARKIRIGRPPAEGLFYIQAGTFKSKPEALSLKETIESTENLKTTIEMIHLDVATWYRVELGPYRTLADAEKIRDFLREKKTIDSIINTRTSP